MSGAMFASDTVLVFEPALAEKVGLNEAIFLQQIFFWEGVANKNGGGREVDGTGARWIYKSAAQWKRDHFPFWSERTIQALISRLRELDAILVQQRDGTDRTNHYRINPAWVERNKAVGIEEARVARGAVAVAAHAAKIAASGHDAKIAASEAPSSRGPYKGTEGTAEDTPPAPKVAGGGHGKKVYPADFERLWEVYGKVGGKEPAFKKFLQARPDAALLDEMFRAIRLQKSTDRWLRGYIMDLSRWLNERRWEDQVETDYDCDPQAVIDLYNEVLPHLPQATTLEVGRRQLIVNRWRWLHTSSREKGGPMRASSPVEALAWFRLFFEKASQNTATFQRYPNRHPLDLLLDRIFSDVVEIPA